MKSLNKIILVLVTITAASCAAIKLEPQASKVQISKNKPSITCKYVSDITASQGAYNDLRNKALNIGGNYVYITHQGALNDLKNQAYEAGGNTVLLLNDNSAMTFSGGGGYGGGGVTGTQTDNILTGSVYKCPQDSI